MTAKQPETSEDLALDKIGTHIDAASKNIMNAQWDESSYHLNKIKELLPELNEEKRQVFTELHNAFTTFTSGFKQAVVGKQDSDIEAAIKEMDLAKQMIQQMREHNPQVEKQEGLVQFETGVSMTSVSLKLVLAQRRKDQQQIPALSAERDRLIDESLKLYSPDDPQRYYLEALKLWNKTMPLLGQCMMRLRRLDLESARQYIQEANSLLVIVRESFKKSGTTDLLMQSPRDMAEGLTQTYSAIGAYINTLYSAITGDVSRTDIERLKTADRELVEAEGLIAKSGPLVVGMSGDDATAINAALEDQRELTRNLRQLCEVSLTPGELRRSASPRFALYFIATFGVFSVGLPLSGATQTLNFPFVAVLLMVSFVAALISAFGFESLRFVPWFDRLTGFITKMFGAGDKQAKQEN